MVYSFKLNIQHIDDTSYLHFLLLGRNTISPSHSAEVNLSSWNMASKSGFLKSQSEKMLRKHPNAQRSRS